MMGQLSACTVSVPVPDAVAVSGTESVGALYGIGQVATAHDIEKWNTDVKPNGEGLPPGRGGIVAGEVLFEVHCKTCHGEGGIGGPFGSLVSTDPDNQFDFSTNPDRPKTIGNYWPFATTLFDYIQRAMPFETPGSLAANEVYSLVAYLLHENRLLAADTVLDQQNLPLIVMPARDRFVPDDRKGGNEVR